MEKDEEEKHETLETPIVLLIYREDGIVSRKGIFNQYVKTPQRERK